VYIGNLKKMSLCFENLDRRSTMLS